MLSCWSTINSMTVKCDFCTVAVFFSVLLQSTIITCCMKCEFIFLSCLLNDACECVCMRTLASLPGPKRRRKGLVSAVYGWAIEFYSLCILSTYFYTFVTPNFDTKCYSVRRFIMAAYYGIQKTLPRAYPAADLKWNCKFPWSQLTKNQLPVKQLKGVSRGSIVLPSALSADFQ